MENLLDFFAERGSDGPQSLQEFRLGSDPATVILFSDAAEPAALHYIEDDSYRCYAVCPGTGCPLCHLGTASAKFALTPVLSIEAAEVQVLRIPVRRGIGSLFAGLQPLLADSHIADKLVLISRTGNRYTVRSQPLGESADRGETVIARFLETVKAGGKLSSAFISPPAAELAEIPRIRRRLDAVGDYRPATECSDEPEA